MICREYVGNFLLFFLQLSIIHYELSIINYHCEFFLSDNEYLRYFIHNFQIWCKINKFISFFSKKLWKSCVYSDNKLVDIHLPISLQYYFVSYSLSYPHTYQHFFHK